MNTLNKNFAFGLCFFLTSCGVSPLFNHQKEERSKSLSSEQKQKAALPTFDLNNWLNDFPEKCEILFSNLNLCAEIHFDQAVAYEEPAQERTFLIKIWNTETKNLQSPTDIPRILFEMPSGCCGLQTANVENYSDGSGNEIDGLYKINKIYFSHKGLYEVRVRLSVDEKKETNKYVFVLP